MNSKRKVGRKFKFTQETVTLTPEFAHEFLETLEEFAGERNKRENWVDQLAQEMASNNFRWELVVLAQAKYDGKIYRINGQNTCWARLSDEDNKEWSKPVQLVTYTVPDYEGLRELYDTFDVNWTRSHAHRIRSQLAGYEGFGEIPVRKLGVLAKGYAFWRWPDTKERRDVPARDLAVELKETHYELGIKVGSFLTEMLNGAESSTFGRACVVGAMFGCFDKAPNLAKEFWSKVVMGAELAKGSPELALRNYLLNVRAQTTTSVRKVTPEEEQYRTCIYYWNTSRGAKGSRSVKNDLRGERRKFS